MDKSKALDLLRTQLTRLMEIRYQEASPDFDKWRRNTRVVLEQVFGQDSRQAKEFEGVRFRPDAITRDKSRRLALNTDGFNRGKSRAVSLLESIISSEVEQFWDESDRREAPSVDPLALVRKLCSRFGEVARQLRKRHDNRPTLAVQDEYDVQDLLHALLRIEFNDIRPEECTPSYAGKSARMDFLIKDHSIVIEVKKTRPGLGQKEIGDELLVDIARYKEHRDCKTLVCFVYDPEHRIDNPAGLERDLSMDKDGLTVEVMVTPK